MQKTFSIITMISLFLAGCSHEQPCQDSLLQAERIIDQNTDSLATTQDSALYGLLFTEAVHRKGLTFNNDTLIAQSENYYRNVGNNDCRLARSLLHHAIVRYSQQSYAEAFALIKEAEEMAAQLGDPAFCYELYAVLGDMYDNAYDKTATLHYYQRSLDATISVRWMLPDRHATTSGQPECSTTWLPPSTSWKNATVSCTTCNKWNHYFLSSTV